MNYTRIKQVYETTNVKEVNEFLKNDWVLLGTCIRNDFTYILGKVNVEAQNIKTKDIKSFNSVENLKAHKKRNEDIKKLEREAIVKRSRLINIANGIFVEII